MSRICQHKGHKKAHKSASCWLTSSTVEKRFDRRHFFHILMEKIWECAHWPFIPANLNVNRMEKRNLIWNVLEWQSFVIFTFFARPDLWFWFGSCSGPRSWPYRFSHGICGNTMVSSTRNYAEFQGKFSIMCLLRNWKIKTFQISEVFNYVFLPKCWCFFKQTPGLYKVNWHLVGGLYFGWNAQQSANIPGQTLSGSIESHFGRSRFTIARRFGMHY